MHEGGELFANQTEWVQFLIDLARSNSEWQIVIRLHPRMFPNRRDSVLAPAAEQLLDQLQYLPKNVILNAPSNGLSLTDVLQVVDVGLAGTSSVGLQMLSLGLPLVVHDPKFVFAYPPGLGRTVNKREDYATEVSKAIQEGWSIENVRGAFRFIHYRDTVVAREIFWRNTHEAKTRIRSRPWHRFRLGSRAMWYVSTKAPAFLKNSIRRRKRERLISQSLATLGRRPNLYDPFEDVLVNLRAGLHEVPLLTEPAAFRHETAALQSELRLMSSLLGRFPEDPRALTTRIEDHLKEAQIQPENQG